MCSKSRKLAGDGAQQESVLRAQTPPSTATRGEAEGTGTDPARVSWQDCSSPAAEQSEEEPLSLLSRAVAGLCAGASAAAGQAPPRPQLPCGAVSPLPDPPGHLGPPAALWGWAAV